MSDELLRKVTEMRNAIDMIEGALMGLGDFVDLPDLFEGTDAHVNIAPKMTVGEMRRVCTALAECTRIINSDEFDPAALAATPNQPEGMVPMPTVDEVRQTIADEWGSQLCYHDDTDYKRDCDKDKHCRCADVARAILNTHSAVFAATPDRYTVDDPWHRPATPSGIQGALALYLDAVQPFEGRLQINISFEELSVLRRLVAATKRCTCPGESDETPHDGKRCEVHGCHLSGSICSDLPISLRCSDCPTLAAAPAVGGEPVAWRILPEDTLFLRGATVTDDTDIAETWRKTGCIVEPLYVIQPAQAAIGGDAVAWRWRTLSKFSEDAADQEWELVPTAPNFINPHHHEVQPLYAAQPASPLRGNVCCYCDAPLSCARCGMEQPDDTASPLRGIETDLKTSEEDESLMRATLLKCYSEGRPYAFRVSKEHYLYLAEQIIALREGSRRMAAASPLRGREAVIEECARVADKAASDNKDCANSSFESGGQGNAILFMESARTCEHLAGKIRTLSSASPPEQPAAAPVTGRGNDS